MMRQSRETSSKFQSIFQSEISKENADHKIWGMILKTGFTLNENWVSKAINEIKCLPHSK